MVVIPYKNNTSSKKEQITTMFDNIAHHYDFLNHLLSMGIDIRWRKKAIAILKKEKPSRILDIATGTGDFAIESLSLNPEKVIGVDISQGMLDKGKIKIKEKKLDNKIELMLGDSENLPFENNSFDAITVGFGVRNFENLEKGLADMARVLKDNGTAVILEFSKPNGSIRWIYNFYFQKICPFIGKLFSKDNAAYTYLPESVNAFPSGDEFLKVMTGAGFKDTKCYPLSFGIASIYVGKK